MPEIHEVDISPAEVIGEAVVTPIESVDVESTWAGRGLIIAAAVLWSTSGFFAKAPWFDAWPAEIRGLQLAFWRSLFAIAVLLPLIRRPKFSWQVLPMAGCFAVMVWSFMTAMVHGPAATAIWLQYLSPAWVLTASVCLLGQRAVKADVRMVACCLSGVVLILAMEMRAGGSLYAIAMGILSGIAFAGVVLAIRSLREADAAWLITICHGSTVLLLSPWVWNAPSADATAYVALAFFGVFQMSLPYILFAIGLRSTGSAEASVLTLIEPVLLPLWVFIAWRHHPSYQSPQWWTFVGGALIMTGLLGRYLPAIVAQARRRRRVERSY